MAWKSGKEAWASRPVGTFASDELTYPIPGRRGREHEGHVLGPAARWFPKLASMVDARMSSGEKRALEALTRGGFGRLASTAFARLLGDAGFRSVSPVTQLSTLKALLVEPPEAPAIDGLWALVQAMNFRRLSVIGQLRAVDLYRSLGEGARADLRTLFALSLGESSALVDKDREGSTLLTNLHRFAEAKMEPRSTGFRSGDGDSEEEDVTRPEGSGSRRARSHSQSGDLASATESIGEAGSGTGSGVRAPGPTGLGEGEGPSSEGDGVEEGAGATGERRLTEGLVVAPCWDLGALLPQVLGELVHPERVDVGFGMAGIVCFWLSRRNPAEYVRLLHGLLVRGSVSVEALVLRWDGRDRGVGGIRAPFRVLDEAIQACLEHSSDGALDMGTFFGDRALSFLSFVPRGASDQWAIHSSELETDHPSSRPWRASSRPFGRERPALRRDAGVDESQ